MTPPAPSPALASALFLSLLALSACARPTGDFGRADPSYTHDTVLPIVGAFVARHGREELVSDFGRTDRETTLRDRAWAIVMPPHAKDWLGRLLVEGQRTRLLPEIDDHYDIGAYHRLLRREAFRSSEARWSRLIDDIGKDAALAEPFWAEARAVRLDDEARVAALEARADLGPDELRSAYGRIDENARTIDWVWRALGFRIEAYRNAIGRLAVENPSEKRDVADRALEVLKTTVKQAVRGPLTTAADPPLLPQPSRYAMPVVAEPAPRNEAGSQ